MTQDKSVPHPIFHKNWDKYKQSSTEHHRQFLRHSQSANKQLQGKNYKANSD